MDVNDYLEAAQRQLDYYKANGDMNALLASIKAVILAVQKSEKGKKK